jgi:hypothetical protein
MYRLMADFFMAFMLFRFITVSDKGKRFSSRSALETRSQLAAATQPAGHPSGGGVSSINSQPSTINHSGWPAPASSSAR